MVTSATSKMLSSFGGLITSLLSVVILNPHLQAAGKAWVIGTIVAGIIILVCCVAQLKVSWRIASRTLVPGALVSEALILLLGSIMNNFDAASRTVLNITALLVATQTFLWNNTRGQLR